MSVEDSERRAFMSTAMGMAGGVLVSSSALAAQSASSVTSSPAHQFTGKVALITGGTSGIGRAAAEMFAAEGARVVFCGRRETLGGEVQEIIRKSGGDATFVKCDVRIEAQIKLLVEATITKYGKLDIAFNNAGVDKPPAFITDIDSAVFDDQIATNLRGVFLSMKYELPHLVKAKGSMINMGSIGGRHAFSKIIGYAASKAAVIHMTKCCAQEYGKDIRVNVVAPGAIDTEMLKRVQEQWKVSGNQLADAYPIKRLGTAKETAAVVLWLASDAASYVSGQVIGIDGGDLP